MKELFEKQAELFEKYNVLVTCIASKGKNGYEFKSYFKDLNKGYVHNPITYERDANKVVKYYYTYHNSLKEALEWIIKEAEIYTCSSTVE